MYSDRGSEEQPLEESSATPGAVAGAHGASARGRAARSQPVSGAGRSSGETGSSGTPPKLGTLNKANRQNSSERDVVSQGIRGEQSTKTKSARRRYVKRRPQTSMKTQNISKEPLKVARSSKSRPSFTATRHDEYYDDADCSQSSSQENLINNDVPKEVTESHNVIYFGEIVTPSAGPHVNSTQVTEPLKAEDYPTSLRLRSISELLVEPSQTRAPSEDQGAGPSTAANYAPISTRTAELGEVAKEGCDRRVDDCATTVLPSTAGEDDDDGTTERASPPSYSDFVDMLSDNTLQETSKASYLKFMKAYRKQQQRSENEKKMQQLETELRKVQNDLVKHKITQDDIKNLREKNKTLHGQVNKKERLLQAEVKKVKDLERGAEENKMNFKSTLAAKDAIIEQQTQELSRNQKLINKEDRKFCRARAHIRYLNRELKNAKENQKKKIYDRIRSIMTAKQMDLPGNWKEPDWVQKLNRDSDEVTTEFSFSSEEDSDEASTSSQVLPNEGPSPQTLQGPSSAPGGERVPTAPELVDHKADKASKHGSHGKRSKGNRTDQKSKKIHLN